MTTASASIHSPAVQRGKVWPQAPSDVPWFDRPDAMETLDRRYAEGRCTQEQYEWLHKWVVDGYFVARGAVDLDLIDGMLNDLDQVWTASEPVDGLRIEEIRIRPEEPPGVAHADLLQLDLEKRLALRAASTWRVHGFHLHSQNGAAIYANDKLRELCSLVLDAPAEPQYTINFMYGSRQNLHQDTAVFHLHPANYLVGIWLACEDISPDSGPLIYYPGSHKERMFDRFDNYPQTNLRTCSQEDVRSYESWLQGLAGNYEQESFIAQKGDVLLWHGMLIHGGGEVRRPELTRKSYVCHYVAQGKNKHQEIEGPFNW